MRDIKDIIKELEAHPDYIDSSVWTVDRVINHISFEISWSKELYDEVENDDFDEFSYLDDDDEAEYEEESRMELPVITKDMITDSEWSMIKDKISGELCDFIHETNMIDVEGLSLYKPLIREMKINQIIEEK